MANELSITIDKDGIALILLNRPEKHNAFNDKLITELSGQLESLDQNPEVRVVVLTGSGESFSSGADITWMKSMVNYDQETNRNDAIHLAELMQQLYSLSKPTIARVNGSAYGGALGLIACCDIAIAVDHAKFSFSEVKLGIAPAVISPYVISAIGTRHAKKLFLTGEIFDSIEAVRINLLHSSVPLSDFDNTVNTQIKYLLKGGPNAQAEIKEMIQHFSIFEKDIKWKTAEIIAKLRTSDEGQEGLGAFLNKRKPSWTTQKESDS